MVNYSNLTIICIKKSDKFFLYLLDFLDKKFKNLFILYTQWLYLHVCVTSILMNSYPSVSKLNINMAEYHMSKKNNKQRELPDN